MKKHGTTIIITCVLLILFIGYYIYSNLALKAPVKKPYVKMKYNGTIIDSTMGEHNWFHGNGGNSYLAGPSYKVGQEKASAFTAKMGDKISVSFSSKPKKMKVLRWISDDTPAEIYNTFPASSNYRFSLPYEKGEYVFEILGYWDDKHNTSNIFRVIVE